MDSKNASDDDSSSSSSSSSGESNPPAAAPVAPDPRPASAGRASVTDAQVPAPSRKRKAAAQYVVTKTKKHKKGSEKSDSLRKLSEQVNNIENFLASGAFAPTFYNCPPVPMPPNSDDEISLNVSEGLFSDDDRNYKPTSPALAHTDSGVNFSINTVLKEPSVSKSSKAHLDLLTKVQHLDTPEWCDVRYSEVQKTYSSTPGFIDLECNEEIKPFDRYPNLCMAERSYAAITQALLKQKDAAQAGFDSFLNWATTHSDDLSPALMKNKLNEIFVEGSYNKISSDLLQLVCGHRADTIEQRRDSVLRSVKDKFLRSNLRKIPPTSSHLFNKDAFSNAIEKAGGSGKVFWPSRSTSQKSGWSAAQAGPSNSKTQGFQFQGPRGPYSNRPSQNHVMQNAYSYQPYNSLPGAPPLMSHYPAQGFYYPTQGYPNQRLAQSHYKPRPDSSRNNRQKSNYDDNRSNQAKQNKNFRPKRKF